MSYLDAMAGVPISEPRPDADVRAVDCAVCFPEGDVHVQVKCSAKLVGRSSASIRWDLDPGWVDKWGHFKTPVYLLIVRVLQMPTWIEHSRTSTLHHAYALWKRVNMRNLGKPVSVPLRNQFSAQTLKIWRQDYIECFNTRVSP